MTWAGPGYSKRNDESAPPDEPGGWVQNLAGDPYGMHWRPAHSNLLDRPADVCRVCDRHIMPGQDRCPNGHLNHLWPCGCLRNEAGAHRVGCPDHPEGVNPRG